jgi:hypothetical protein
MPGDEVVAIARVPLARSRRRMLAAPLILLLVAAAAVAAGLFTDGWARYALLGGAALPMLLALYLVAVVSTVRLDVEVSTLRLRWIGVDRRYTLARGAVTRVPLRGERAAKLRPRFGAFGWGLGSARLRGEETIQLVRLARSPAVILVPTEAGRVGIAPASEEQFLQVLAEAARVQQRLDQVAARARAIPLERPPAEEPPVAEPPVAPVPVEVPRDHVMTGIERALLEERLAAERAAALAEAEAERRAVEEARRQAEEARLAAERPAAVATANGATSPGSAVAIASPAAAERPRAAGRVPRPRISAPSARGLSRDRMLSMAVAMLPLVAGAAVWGAAALADALKPTSPDGQIVVLALILAGPAAALGALAARAWFPRLVGLITITAACALVLIGRSLFV